jgi:hypothetical protein
MPQHNYRQSARLHLQEAKDFLSKPGEASARHACLELRMTIEALVYELLQAYLAEVPNSVMAAWQPKKVLDELLHVDPHADQTSTIFVGVETTPGVAAEKMELLGTDRRFTIKWGNKAHNALGSFLHEPSIAERDKGKNFDKAARDKAGEIIAELDAILSAPIFQVNFGEFVEITCECGFVVKRKEAVVTEGKEFSCGECGLVYDYKQDAKTQSWKFWKATARWGCKACEQENHVEVHRLDGLPMLTCSHCGTKSKVSRQFVISPLPD